MTASSKAWNRVTCHIVLHDLRSTPCNAGESFYDVPSGESKNRLTNVGQNLLALGLLVLLADLGLVRGPILRIAGSLLFLVLQPLLHQAVPIVTSEDHNCHRNCCHQAATSAFQCCHLSLDCKIKNIWLCCAGQAYIQSIICRGCASCDRAQP